MKTLPNIHPGKALLEEFLKPLGISQNRLARAMGVPPRRINEIVHGERAITADTALRLARAVDTSEQFWMGLQADYDLEEVEIQLGLRSKRETPPPDYARLHGLLPDPDETDDMIQDEIKDRQQQIGPTAERLYKHFARGAGQPVQPYVRETPKVGRTDPCPCCSGKEYKRCCLL